MKLPFSAEDNITEFIEKCNFKILQQIDIGSFKQYYRDYIRIG